MFASIVRTGRAGRVANVVLLPDGVAGDAVLKRAGLWVMAGLLDPVLWVRPAAVTPHPALPARIDAVVIGRGEDETPVFRTVPLFETLGQEPVDEIILASLRWPIGTDEQLAKTTEAARITLSMLDDSRPLPIAGVPGTRLRTLNVLVSPTLLDSSQVERLVDARWQDNIVVAPEDRQRPSTADRFVDAGDEDAWTGFALASLAGLAGLWTGHVGSPVPASAGSGSSGSHPLVHVARTFSRAVVTDDYMDELAHAAAHALANPQIPETVGGVKVLLANDAEEVVAHATESLLEADSSALRYSGIAPPPSLQRRKVGLSRGLGSFLRFSFDKVVVLPFWAWGWIAEKLGRGAERSLYGKESGVFVDARRDLGLAEASRELIEVNDAMAQATRRVQRAVAHPRYVGPRIQTTAVWEVMRTTVFALVDGGPNQAQVLQEAVVGVVPDVGMVIPAPTDVWVLPAEVARHLGGDNSSARTVSWTDLSSARELVEHLGERTQDLQQRLLELEARAVASQSEVLSAERDFVEARDRLEDLKADLSDAEDRMALAKGAVA